MAAHRPSSTQLRDRLLSNSPDFIKSSILRESNMGWNSPPTSSDNTAASSATSPLRISKRESSPNLRPTQADLARRSSSSYKHMRNNNLVSKSPFKSQIPTPSTPSRHTALPVSFPTRRVSGEKRPRPPSMHDEAENENDRPFALKRERKQSRTFQGLIQKEPVTKSPFRQAVSSSNDGDLKQRKASPPAVPPPSSRIPTHSGASPVRPSLVTKRMHGPRLSGAKRERRKTVTFHENCEVVEFSRDEDESGEVFESDEDDNYGNAAEDDVDFFGEGKNEETPHDSYEDIELSDQEPEEQLELDADTSITGLVDEIFAGSRQTSTPPRHHPNELPPDLETEDGVPLGRTHHADRVIKYHQEHESHLFVEPAPHTIVHTPTFPIHATAASPPPSTPSHRNRFSSPPLGRSTHFERLQSARIEEEDIDRDVKMLPDSPSPMKPSSKTHVDEASMDGLVPKFELPGYSPVRRDYPTGSDPFAMPNLQDESLPLDAGSFVQDDSIMSVTTTEHSEVNISALEKELGNERLINTSMEASPIDLAREASFTQADSPASAPVRRSPLPPIPSSVPHRISSPAMRSSSPLSPRGSVSPFASPVGARPRSNRDDVHRRFLRPRSFGNASPSGSPKINDGGRGLRTSVDRQRIVDLSIEHSPEREDDHKEQLDSEINFERETEKDASSVMTTVTENSAEMATIETAEKRKVVAVGVVQEHEPAETEASMEVTHDVTMDFEVKGEELQEQAEPNEPVHQDQPEPIAVTQAIELRDQSFSGDEVDSGMDDDDDADDDDNGEEFGLLKAPAFTNSKKLKFDLGSKFGLGKLGFLDLELSSEDLTTPSTSDKSDLGFDFNTKSSKVPPKSVQNMPVGSVNVRMDMRSALDRLMDDVASVGGSTLEEPHDISMTTTEEDAPRSQLMQRAATDSIVVGSLGPPRGSSVHSAMPSRNASTSSSIAPPPPPKDNIRAREAMIIEKRRKMRRMEEGDDDDDDRPLGVARAQLSVPTGRPSRRRSMSTGDAEDLGAKRRGVALRGQDSQLSLDVNTSPTGSDDALSDEIEKELKKNIHGSEKKKKKYFIREHEGTIYASSDVSHMAGPGDVNAGKAWRTVRRPSDMNEYAKQIREFRNQEKPGKSYGKVFVKVLGAKGLVVPMPAEQTAVSCTLNNGIHFVTTPDFRLGKDCRIEQEFELIEHSKLEFTLTLKVRRDPHIIAQFKAIVPPAPPRPPPMAANPSSSSKSSGMRSFFHSSPKKNKDKDKRQNTPPPPPPPQLPPQRLTENLARYLKPDGTLARAFVSFKDIAGRCDTRLFETTFPLIGQRAELGNKFSTLQVGELVLQVFRLPPLPGLPPEELPQSLEECHRGLRHVNWHKMTYFEGTLTQNGGDCSSWRRRRFRVIGANLVAFNDVTKRVTATINLRNAITVEDNQDPHKRDGAVRSPASGASLYYDEYDGLFGVERSFRLVFPEEEILFFADTDEEKAKWLEILNALVGHIPPHPLWAELLWQRQEDLNKVKRAQPQAANPAPGPSRQT
ncbi:uncharacterized protein C8R40DRAFT_524145 [Lentinula edodes]|uniref:uncharacterized protein n=1 Tax=Lentinula edodes TaxID=5353 RepID=UPI001E8CD155|nr:uncharacterized protein C8R40DRAFT_524145 [Lentinula edodes]KAH7872054.1 hypothetical protein C8R40DRAFT_524145 [Lentinula edodes]